MKCYLDYSINISGILIVILQMSLLGILQIIIWNTQNINKWLLGILQRWKLGIRSKYEHKCNFFNIPWFAINYLLRNSCDIWHFNIN